jgi:predicted NBD/HSP70 family sugar kinase
VALECSEGTDAAGLPDLNLHIRQVIKEPTDLARGLQGLLKQVQQCARKVIRKLKVSMRSFLGICIADPGLVDSRRGITTTSSTIEFWKQVPLRQGFEAEFKIPAFVESKTRAKTVAEISLGAGNSRRGRPPLANVAVLAASRRSRGGVRLWQGSEKPSEKEPIRRFFPWRPGKGRT